MRRIFLASLASISLLAPLAARADVIRFTGDARIQLHEVLDPGDSYTLETSEVDLAIELTGARHPLDVDGPAVGTATITRANGEVTTLVLQGSMYPPEGSGGFVMAGGFGDDGAAYCFRIWDLADAPSPQPDRLVGAFRPVNGGVPNVSTQVDCYSLEYRYQPPVSGGFSFETVL